MAQILQTAFSNELPCTCSKIFVFWQISTASSLVQIMVWHRFSNKPWSEPVITELMKHIPQWGWRHKNTKTWEIGSQVCLHKVCPFHTQDRWEQNFDKMKYNLHLSPAKFSTPKIKKFQQMTQSQGKFWIWSSYRSAPKLELRSQILLHLRWPPATATSTCGGSFKTRWGCFDIRHSKNAKKFKHVSANCPEKLYFCYIYTTTMQMDMRNISLDLVHFWMINIFRNISFGVNPDCGVSRKINYQNFKFLTSKSLSPIRGYYASGFIPGLGHKEYPC